MVIVVIRDIVLTKKNMCGPWSLELLGTPNFLKQIGYGGLVVILIFKKKNPYVALGY